MKLINKEIFVIHKVETEGNTRHASTYRKTKYDILGIPIHTKLELLRKEDIK